MRRPLTPRSVPDCRRLVGLFLLVASGAVPRVAAQEAPRLSLSGVTEFWRIADAYAGSEGSGVVPDEAWDRLFQHPGYAQLDRQAQRRRVLERCVPLVFAPGNAAALRALLDGTPGLTSRVCRHLIRVRDHRAELDRFGSQLDLGDIYRRGLERAGAYLPDGITALGEQPEVHVMLFENNGFGGARILLDLLRLMDDGENELVGLLGHELHHAYAARVPNKLRSIEDHRWITNALSRMRGEGVASLIDKRNWITEGFGAHLPEERRSTIEQFTALYGSSPERLTRLDRLIRDVADGSVSQDSADSQVQDVIPFGGHATGMYMALTVEEAFGREILSALDPLEFVLQYHAAAVSMNRPVPFSEHAIAWLSELRRTLLVN